MADCTSKQYRERNRRVIAIVSAVLALGTLCLAADKSSDVDAARVTAVRFWSLGETTRIAIEVSNDFHFKYERLQNPDRLYFDLFGARPTMAQRGIHSIPVDDSLVKQLRVAETQPGVTRIVIDLKQAVELTTSQLSSPNRLMVEVKPKSAKNTDGNSEMPVTTSTSGGKTLPEALTASAAMASAAVPVPASAMARELVAKTSIVDTPITKTPIAKVSATKTAAKVAVPSNPAVEAVVSPAAMLHTPTSVKSWETDGSDASSNATAAIVPPTPVAAAKPRETLRSALKSAAAKNSEAAIVDRPAMEKTPSAKSAENRNEDMGGRTMVDRTTGDRRAGTLLASLPPEPVDQAFSEKNLSDRTVSEKAPSDRSGRDDVKEVLPPKPGALNDRSLVRTLGLKLGRVVIDAGHGGNDVGTHGPSGYFEKDLSLDVAKRLAALIRENMGSDVVLTRSEDVYVGLEERTRLANEHRADLFLSIHANSSPYRSAAGVETFVLNFTTNKSVMDLATRENAGSEMSIHDLQDLLQKIALRDKVDESRELATKLQTSLSRLSTVANDAARNRGVKKAPFVVLIGANMPSVLAEIGFLTNAADEALLRKPEHRQKIAEALFQGIASYGATLSQVVARKN